MIAAAENAAKAVLPPSVVTRIRPAYRRAGRVSGKVVDVLASSQIELEVNGSTVAIEHPSGLRSYFRNQIDGDTVENCLPTAACVVPEGVDAIYDVGAYTGLYTALLSRLNPGIPVYAYEPHCPSREFCHRTVAANDVPAAVYPLAVTGACGETTFHVSSAGPQGHSTVPNGKTGQTTDVTATTISNEIERHGAAFPFVKIDVEGAEAAVLQDLLERDGPVAGLVELHPEKLPGGSADLVDRLRNSCDEVTLHGDSSPNHPDADYIGSGPNRPIYGFRRFE